MSAARVGIVEIRLYLRESRSLKDKRSVLQSLKDRLRNEFNVAVAEVDRMNNRQMATIAATTVSNDGRYVQGQISRIVDFCRRFPGVELVDSEFDVL